MKYIKYSHKLFLVFLITIFGIALPLSVNHWIVWIAYIFGFVLSAIFTTQVFSENNNSDKFKLIVYKFNHWVELDKKDIDDQREFKNNILPTSALAGVVGLLTYFVLRLFKNFEVITYSEFNGSISFIFGAITGLCFTVTYLARRIEQSYKNNLILAGNKPSETNVETKESNPIATITLTENELVACIALLNNDLKDIPLEKVVKNYVIYNLGKEFIKRYGLRETYEFEMILQGLKSLEKRGLIIEKEVDKDLIILTGIISFGDKMIDGTYYRRNLHMIASYEKDGNGNYILKLFSEGTRKLPGISVGKKLTILLVIGGIVFIGRYLWASFLEKTIQQEPVSIVKPSEVNLSALGVNKLAYVKNGNIFLADKNGLEQITSGHKVSNLKVSHDGKYLGWIEKKDFTVENKTTKSVGYSISYVNLSTLEITYEVVGPFNFVSNEDIYKKEILDFDYLNTNPLTIIYTSDGVWKKEFSTNKNEKLLNNDYGKENSPLDDKRYSSVVVNNKLNTLSLTTGGWEWCKTEFYDIRQTKLTSIEDSGFCQGIWSNDGKSFFVYSSYGMKEGGLWQIDAVNGKLIKNIFDPRLGLTVSVDTLDILDNGSLIASLKPIDSEGNKNQSIGLSLNGTSIYHIDDIAQPRPRFIKQTNVLLNYHYNSSPIKHLDNNEISYLSNNAKNQDTYDLYVIDLNGKNDQEIVKGISDNVWIPKNEKQATKVTNKTYTNDKYGFSFEYPSEFSQRAIKDTDYSFILSTESVTLSTVDGNAQYYKKNIGWKIKPNANNFKSIRDWYVNNYKYNNWQEVEKDLSVREEIRSNVNVISHRSSSAEYFIIDSFVMLNDGQVLELDIWILSTNWKSEPREEVIGEELNSLIINSFKIK